MPKRNIGGCPSDADDMLAISKMKAFFWQCSRLGPHQLELDVAWEGGETYGFWFFGEKRALGLPNPLVLPARLPSEEQIDIVRALCNFEETPPRWHLDATVQHPESVFIGNERYTVLLLRRLSESSWRRFLLLALTERALVGIPYAATYEEVMHAQGFESEVMGKYGAFSAIASRPSDTRSYANRLRAGEVHRVYPVPACRRRPGRRHVGPE
jgi:hypothetical protein